MKKHLALAAAASILAFHLSSALAADAAKPAAAPPPAAKPAAKPAATGGMTEQQQTLYALGALLSQALAQFDLKPDELPTVEKGLHDALRGAKMPFKPEEQMQKIQELQRTRMAAISEKASAAGNAYLAKAATQPGATKTASGMVIKHTKVGTGAQPAATDQVKVNYEGRLIDGKVFDSSIARNEPATFPLNGVIPCWTEGVQTMKVGGKAQFVCPANLAYGPQGSPPTIPPSATLVFDVELLDVIKPPANPAPKPQQPK